MTTRRSFLHLASIGLGSAATASWQRTVTEVAPQLQLWAASWTRSSRYIDEIVAAMPEGDFQYRPVPEVRTFGEQLLHLAQAVDGFAGLIGPTPTAGPPAAEPTTKAGIRARVRDAMAGGSAAIATVTPARVADTVPWAGRGYEQVTRMPILGVIQVMHDHTTHHRGQCVVYLRLRGMTPPTYVD